MFQYLFVGVFVLVLQINGGHAIKCYSCSSEFNRSCLKPYLSNISLVECSLETMEETQRFAASVRPEYKKVFEVDLNHITRQLPLSCLKQVTKVENKEYVIRGCQLAEQNNLDICHKVKTEDRATVATLHCSRCGTDGCNSAGEIFDVASTFFAVLCALTNAYVRVV
ncbi:unnamed protein product [Brassicogethes aeneus]|uniref:Protein sleepless n=1 Tax=Brassicogethes aeneus TaxID=1431903 RepID=A0A9P0BFN3_BRAAE|nr:unnamed protein product [Brassicogethes aeneus]